MTLATSIPSSTPALRTGSTVRPTRFLRAAWLVDAAGSAGTGLAMGLAAGPLAAWTGLPAAWLVGAAAVFVPYVALLAWLGTRTAVGRRAAAVPVGLNVAWGAVCLAVAATASLPALGLAFLAVHVVWGFGFAALQAAGLRRTPAA